MWPSSKRDARSREDDPDVWGALYERFHPGEGGADRPGRSPLSSDSKARLLDAALGIVGSVRTFFEVAEDVLLEQRDRLRHGAPPDEPWATRVSDPPPRQPTSSAVQDIPMEDT